MNFAFSEEQEEIRATLRAFLEERAPLAEARRAMALEHGFDPALWRALAEELGLAGLIVPTELDGAGLGAVELCGVMEELGRALACVPFFSTVALAANALLRLGDDASQRRWLPEVASGELVATLAVVERDGRWDEASIATTAEPKGGRVLLSGVKHFVTDGSAADLILVVARQGGRFGVYAVTADAAGLERSPLPALDQTRPIARIALADVAADPIGPLVDWPEIQHVLAHACAALVAEQVGAAQRALDMAVDYAKVREQFGRTIGSFQAIKHKCADMLMRVESARAAAYYCGWAASQDDRDALRSATSVAKADVSEAFLFVSEQNLQIHGGLGFTWEQDPHLFLRRARSTHVLLGDPAHHRRLTAAALIDGATD